MKTQIYGLSHGTETPFGDVAWQLNPNWYSSTKQEARDNYKKNRENGDSIDNPPNQFLDDGSYSWEYTQHAAKIRYLEGPHDRIWMETKDRNYLKRLMREKTERQLTEQETQDIEEGLLMYPDIAQTQHQADINKELRQQNESLQQQLTQQQDQIAEMLNLMLAFQQEQTVGASVRDEDFGAPSETASLAPSYVGSATAPSVASTAASTISLNLAALRKLADDAKASREAQSARIREWASRTAEATSKTPTARIAEGEATSDDNEVVDLPDPDI